MSASLGTVMFFIHRYIVPFVQHPRTLTTVCRVKSFLSTAGLDLCATSYQGPNCTLIQVEYQNLDGEFRLGLLHFNSQHQTQRSQHMVPLHSHLVRTQ